MRITATTVRVPVYRSHSESVNIEFEHDLELKDMAAAINAFPGIQMMDDPSNQIYPMPLYTSENMTASLAVCAAMSPIRTPLTCG